MEVPDPLQELFHDAFDLRRGEIDLLVDEAVEVMLHVVEDEVDFRSGFGVLG